MPMLPGVRALEAEVYAGLVRLDAVIDSRVATSGLTAGSRPAAAAALKAEAAAVRAKRSNQGRRASIAVLDALV
jgi:hypothetical protein